MKPWLRRQRANDRLIARLLAEGRLRVDFGTGDVFATRSNTPKKPIGSPTPKGYLRVSIYLDGKCKPIMLHRAVWIAAHGVPPSSTPQINHKDTVKRNNRLTNLELQTNAGNLQHAWLNGCLRIKRGEKAPRAKLTRRKVRSIRKALARGVKQEVLAGRHGVSRQSIHAIWTKKSWGWLP